MRTVHTADLTAGERAQIRAVLDAAFGDRFDDHDWSHALGGLHVLAEAGGRIIAHAAVVQRSLLAGGVPLRAGYVEAVAVHPGHQRLGYATAVMDEVERIIRAGYDIGALSASERAAGLYVRRGWTPWPGTTAVLTPRGLAATPDDDGSTYILPVAGPPPGGNRAVTGAPQQPGGGREAAMGGPGWEPPGSARAEGARQADLSAVLACDFRSGDVW